MKFSIAAITTAAVAGLASAAPAVSQSFGLIAIHSGSSIQNSGIVVADDGTLEISRTNKNWFTGTFNDDHSISVGDKFLSTQADGSLRVSDDKTLLFSDDGESHLAYGQATGFIARDAGDVYKIINADPSDANPKDIGVVLHIQYL